MSKQSWRGSTLLNPEPPVLVSCGGLEQPNLITIGWTGTICTQPSMVSISVRPERYSHHLIKAVSYTHLDVYKRQEHHGYRQYEISNFAKPGYEGRHNLIYWDCGDYLGLGPAAHSCMGGRRLDVYKRQLFCTMRQAGVRARVLPSKAA